MKTINTYYAGAAMLIMGLTTGGLASAAQLPGDLQQLWQAYHAVSLNENSASTQWQLEELTLSPSDQSGDELLKREMAGLKERGMLINSLSYDASKAIDQSDLVRSLLPAKGADKRLCDGFTYDDYAPRAGVTLTSEEMAEANTKYQTRLCRRNINQIFSGIFHAQTPLTVLQAAGEQDGEARKVMIIYISSFAKPDSYLRYSITAPQA